MGSDDLYERMRKEAHHRYGKRRIFSLCKRWDSMSMWAKYAADHRGYCLEFKNDGLFASVREVEYVDVVTENPNDDSDLGNFYFRKNRDWSNEEEVRLLRPRDAPSTATIDPVLLTRIIVGKHMTAELRDQIVRWTQERNPPLVVQRTEFDPIRQALRLL